MSPQFYSALAAIGCHLPACKDIQLTIIPSLSPPRVITLLFLLLPLFFFHLSCYFLIFSAYRKKNHSQLLFFHYLAISILSFTFFLSSSLSLPELQTSSFFTVLFSSVGLDPYFLYTVVV